MAIPTMETEPSPDLELRDVIPRQRYDDPEYELSTDEVLWGMEQIEDHLAAADLEHVIPFNTIYRRLTQLVVERIEFSRQNPHHEQAFQFPDTVERTIGIFADYYFKQLRAYTGATTNEKVDPAWQFLFYPKNASMKAQRPDQEQAQNQDPYPRPDLEPLADKAIQETTFKGIRFLLGMNAHINYDLAQALRDSGVADNYYQDYRRVVGILINIIATELSNEYIPGPTVSRRLLQWSTEKAIALWRNRAWKAGKKLMKYREDEVAISGIMSELDRTSVKTGKRIMRLGNAALYGLSLFEKKKNQYATAL
jgi:hypothetical protein